MHILQHLQFIDPDTAVEKLGISAAARNRIDDMTVILYDSEQFMTVGSNNAEFLNPYLKGYSITIIGGAKLC